MRNIFRLMRVFFGTPLRAISTIAVMAWCSVIETIFPGFLGRFVYQLVHAVTAPVLSAIARLICEAWPLVETGLVVLIMAFGFWVMFRGRRGGR